MGEAVFDNRGPHIKAEMTTRKMMRYIMIALIPAGLHGIFRYGVDAGVVILLTCGSAVATELILCTVMKKGVLTRDYRVLLTGLLMSYCMPPNVPWYVAMLGGILCTLIMQCSLNYFGRNIVSSVILTRLILVLFFEKAMSTYVFDGITMATPLSVLEKDGMVNTLYMIFGNTGGCIGESSTILLCLGAIFLIVLGIMDFRVSGMYLFTFAAFMALFGGQGLSSYFLTAHLAGGGFMLALWFITPDYSMMPITKDGRWVYGIVLGLLTGFFRLYGPGAENLCCAILLANLTVPFIEKLTLRRPFGVEKGQL